MFLAEEIIHLNPDAKSKSTNDNYGFKSRKPTPNIKELAQFETALIELIKNIKFKHHNNKFQSNFNEI